MWVIAAVIVSVGMAARIYPEYKQCDPRWGNNEMGVNGNGERATICKEGCAMSCASMALAGLGVSIPSAHGGLRGAVGGGSEVQATPGSLNAWLESNHGYECLAGDCNNLVLNKIDAGNLTGSPLQLVGEISPPPSFADAAAHVESGDRVYLLHVHDRSHFVLATGAVSDGVMGVNDPFFNTSSYDWSSVADVIEYRVMATGEDTQSEDVMVEEVGEVPHPMPLFKQCNSSWGNDHMGTDTICQVGCLMSDVSMSLRGRGIGLGHFGLANPGSLNAWLRANDGYDNNDLEESAIPRIAPDHIKWNVTHGMHRTNDIPFDDIKTMVQDIDNVVIANVMQGRHFVLVVGWEGTDSIVVNDPGFDKTTYSYSQDVVGWRLFTMIPE